MSFWNGHHWEGVDTHPAAAASAKPESRVKRIGAAALEATLITALTFGLIASTAFAAKGGGAGGGGHRGGSGTTGGTLSLVMVADTHGGAGPNWGDTVTYDTSKTGVTNPFVTTTCADGATPLLTQYAGYYDGYLWPAAKNITLSSEAWTGGGAICTAVVSNSSVKLVYGVAG